MFVQRYVKTGNFAAAVFAAQHLRVSDSFVDCNVCMTEHKHFNFGAGFEYRFARIGSVVFIVFRKKTDMGNAYNKIAFVFDFIVCGFCTIGNAFEFERADFFAVPAGNVGVR